MVINENRMEDLARWADIIGIIAGILVMSSSIPQIMKSYKTKKMHASQRNVIAGWKPKKIADYETTAWNEADSRNMFTMATPDYAGDLFDAAPFLRAWESSPTVSPPSPVERNAKGSAALSLP